MAETGSHSVSGSAYNQKVNSISSRMWVCKYHLVWLDNEWFSDISWTECEEHTGHCRPDSWSYVWRGKTGILLKFWAAEASSWFGTRISWTPHQQDFQMWSFQLEVLQTRLWGCSEMSLLPESKINVLSKKTVEYNIHNFPPPHFYLYPYGLLHLCLQWYGEISDQKSQVFLCEAQIWLSNTSNRFRQTLSSLRYLQMTRK